MNKLKPVMKTSTIELPGGFIIQHQEPDGENYYTEQMMDEAIKEISEPYFKAERQRLIKEVKEKVKKVMDEYEDNYFGSYIKKKILDQIKST
jgi:rRNA maturation endonuclease Nob1